MRCAICNFENPENAAVCEHCGCFLAKDQVPPRKRKSSILAPLGEKRIRCSYCWYSNPAGSEKCERCGMELSYVPYPEREGADEEFVERDEEERRKAAEKQSEVDLAITAELEKPDTNPVPEGMIRCRNCWRDNPVTVSYCQYCDQKLDRPKKGLIPEENEPDSDVKIVICGVCGRKNEAGERNCFHCGSDLPRYYRCDPSVSDLFLPDDDEFEGLFSGTLEAFHKARALDQLEERRKKAEEREKIERSKNIGSVNYSIPGKKRCRSCWYDNPQKAERCQKCGAPLSRVQAGRKKPVPVEVACKCGYENAPDATVCAKCGGVVMKVCPSCGHANSPKLSFCAKCGVRIAPRKNNPGE